MSKHSTPADAIRSIAESIAANPSSSVLVSLDLDSGDLWTFWTASRHDILELACTATLRPIGIVDAVCSSMLSQLQNPEHFLSALNDWSSANSDAMPLVTLESVIKEALRQPPSPSTAPGAENN